MSNDQSPSRVTSLLSALRQGDEHARADLLDIVYPELRRIARRYLRQERPDHTLRTTGLVNEVYLRMFGSHDAGWQNRAHFFAAVARDMRHILVEHARARNAKKRPDQRLMVWVGDVDPAIDGLSEDLGAVDEALSELEQIDPRATRVVELRFFTGLNERETAEALGVSLSTMKRDWQFAKAWLFDRLRTR